MQDTMRKLMVMIMNNSQNKIFWYKLKLKQMSPIHIGKKNYGVLSETRLFIPGWTMWGALVNSYGKLNGGKDENFKEGKELFEKITCFYPKTESIDIMFPKFKDGKLHMGNTSEKEFRRRFTDTYVSTAINPVNISAKDASLHEIEIILPIDRDKRENLYWEGLVGIEESKKNDFEVFIEKTKELYVGGEIAYGFGKMDIVKDKVNEGMEKDLSIWGLAKDGKLETNQKIFSKGKEEDKVCKSENYIKNYIEINKNYELKKGKLEFVVMYDFSGETPSIEKKRYCFVPGSEIDLGKDKNVKNAIKLEKGMLLSNISI